MIKDYSVPPHALVRDAVERLHALHSPAIAIVDSDGVLCGLFTNGDMRRFFLRGGIISSPIAEAMNAQPVLFSSVEEIREAQREHPYIVYPLVDKKLHLLDLVFGDASDDLCSDELSEVPLVIMAGGKGTRLYPYTRILPKALVPLGDSTISEQIIHQVHVYGCRDVHFILNHKAGMIRAYFDDLDRDYDVHYYEEKEFLGTGGGLYLVKEALDSTFILSNCDILIRDDLACAYRTHKEQKNVITFVCAMTNITIPYGVVETDEQGTVAAMREKPEFSFLVNTGVYIVEPEVLSELKENEFIHFPDIAQRCMDAGKRVGVFPVSENSWIDIGEISKMNLAIKQFDGDVDHA
ncbi:MAG: sugar phosphate nucleotidyltransferase [Raoultibacter sp.]